jgi:TonB family protein
MRQLRSGVIICASLTGLGAALNGDFRVRTWLVQPNLNTLSSNGTSVRLEPKVMGVLVCLASQPVGELVSKDAILRTVWPGTFVSEDVLTRSISELRRVFEDDARQPKFIQTIPKRGYRLVAPLERTDGNETPTIPSPRRPLQAKAFVMAATLVLLVVLSLVIRENKWTNWRAKGLTADGSSSRVESSIQDLRRDLTRDLTKDRPTRGLPKLIKRRSATTVPENPEPKKPPRTSASADPATSPVSVVSPPARVETRPESNPLQASLASGQTVSPNVNTRTSSLPEQHPLARIEARIQNIQPDVVRARVTHAVLPIYPAYALQAHIAGTVEIGLGVSPNGDVGSARVLIGHPILITPALEAIRQWRFQPNQVEGELTWSRMRALVRFRTDGTTTVGFAPPLLADSFGDLGTQRDERRDASIPPVVPDAH